MLPPSTPVIVAETTSGWVWIRRSDGSGGWIAAQSLVPFRAPSASGRWLMALAVVAAVAVIASGTFLFVRSRSSPAPAAGSGSDTSQPTAGVLLNQAYDSGKIDRATWLRYSVYAMFGVDALPAQYRGSGPDVDGMSVVQDIQAGAPLDKSLRTELMSFLGRPANPGSVFYGAGPVKKSMRPAPGAQLADTTTCGENDWTSESGSPGDLNTPRHYFKVWTRCDAGYRARLQRVVEDMDDLWPRMNAYMAGGPIQDVNLSASDPAAYGGDGAIDIYLVPPDVDAPRPGGSTLHIDALTARGLTVTVAPQIGKATSAYILIGEGVADDQGVKSTLAHEYFHVLENSRNQAAQFDLVRLHLEENWFTEASSVWAQSYFVPGDASVAVYRRWLPRYLGAPGMPVDARGEQGTAEWYHQYAAFLWLFFMQQERGKEAVAQVWNSEPMREASSTTDGTAAFDLVFPFGDNFVNFALRNLDDPTLKPAIGRLYQDLDPNFPAESVEASSPEPARAGSLYITPKGPSDPPSSTAVSVEHLAAGYYDVNFDATVDQAVFDLSGLTKNLHTTASLLVFPLSSNPTPTLVPLSFTDKTTLCDVTKTERALLVVSNGDLRTAVSGNVNARGTTASCNGGGNVSISNVAPKPWTGSGALVITGTGLSNVHAIEVGPTGQDETPLSGGFWNAVSDTRIEITSDLQQQLSGSGSYDITLSTLHISDPDAWNPPNATVCRGCLVLP